ncbi:MAG: glycosyltransferase family 2 protein, partial [Bacteroidota bacterium]
MRHKVSAVMIAYNEAAIIENTLKALQWCDEIIVVDSGSTDSTWALCEQYGCRLFSRNFDGYGPQKRFAMTQARYDWILSIDADEVVSEVLQKEMSAVLAQENIPAVGYHLPRTMIFLGKKIKSEYGKPCLRLFHKGYGQVTLDKVHEKIQVQGEIHTLQGQLWHYSYRSIHDYFYKFNKYTSFAAEE